MALPTPSNLPTPKNLQAALRKITETLGHELAQPTATAPHWSEFEWTLAKAVGAMHGVSPLLASRLRWSGPDHWTQFLREQRTHTVGRHARIAELLASLDGRARENGIAAVALKGAALHASGLYVAGERPMADIDLLVRPADATATARMLDSLGFRETSASWKERVFTPVGNYAFAALGEHADSHIKMELHDRICERLPRSESDLSDVVFPVRASPGLNDYPSRASLLLHVILHAAGAMASQSLRLLHLHDIASLSRRMTHHDWNEVLDHRAGLRNLWWAFPPVQLTSRYYGSTVPPHVLAALVQDCPPLLAKICTRKSLTAVSYSHLWIDAFPGIEWSQSARLAFGYVANRIRPTAEHIAWRKDSASSGWAAASEWSRLSQGRRILRWVTSRQTRPVTMHAVSAAFGTAP
ncbi:MAG: hypothetical protein JWN43_518 [Gammaproteobacteria bacterium]|nr:hypothetical protein [Gammaproteobacteria bacterium]